MAQVFTYTSPAFYTRDTANYRRHARQKRKQILRQRRRDEEERAQQQQQLEGGETMEEPMLEEPREEGEEGETKMESICSPGPIRWAYGNLYATSISFMLVFSSFVGIQNLQSSLNATLGIVSLSLVYGFYFIVGFFTPAIVRLLTTKYALLFGYICHLIYIIANYYPEYYTLVPSSILLGIGSGPVWAGLSTHLGTTAITLAPHVTDSIDLLISRFTGIFFFIFQLTQIVGNVISSLVLFPYGANDTLVLPEVCSHVEAQSVSDNKFFVLISLYVLLDILGIAVLLLFVKKVPNDNQFMDNTSKVRHYCVEPFKDVIRILGNWKMLLLGPLSLYNGMELGFAYGSFTEVYISECVGVSMVGFVLLVLGFFSATTSFLYGKLVAYIPRYLLTLTAFVINLFFYLFLEFWVRVPSYVLIFLFAVGWGVADGIWNTMSASLVGILFPSNQEAAYSAFRIWMSLGFAIGFAIAEVKTIENRIWLFFAVLVVSFSLYTVLEFFIGKYGAKFCKNMSMDNEDEMMEEMLNGDSEVTGGVAMQTDSTYKQGMTISLEEFTRPIRESDVYELFEDSRQRSKKGKTVS